MHTRVLEPRVAANAVLLRQHVVHTRLEVPLNSVDIGADVGLDREIVDVDEGSTKVRVRALDRVVRELWALSVGANIRSVYFSPHQRADQGGFTGPWGAQYDNCQRELSGGASPAGG